MGNDFCSLPDGDSLPVTRQAAGSFSPELQTGWVCMEAILRMERSRVIAILVLLQVLCAQGGCLLLHEFGIEPLEAKTGIEAREEIKETVSFSYFVGIYLEATARGIEVAGFSAEANQEAVDSIASTEFFTGIIESKTYTGSSVKECQEMVQKAGFLIYFPGGVRASILNALSRCRLEETGRYIHLSDTIRF